MVKEILNECVEHFISKMEENILSDDFDFGKFRFFIYTNSLEIKYVTYTYSSGDHNYDTLIEFNFSKNEYPEIIWFWYNKEKKKDILQRNKIRNILKQRKVEKDRQEKLKQNETLISCLPEERQKQIYRTAKLKRITKDESIQ